jgi:hypothetical protein
LNEAQEKAKILALDRADQRLASLCWPVLPNELGCRSRNGIRLSVRLTRQDMAEHGGRHDRNGHPHHGAFQDGMGSSPEPLPALSSVIFLA